MISHVTTQPCSPLTLIITHIITPLGSCVSHVRPGGFAAVYLATDSLGSQFALKKARPQPCRAIVVTMR